MSTKLTLDTICACLTWCFIIVKHYTVSKKFRIHCAVMRILLMQDSIWLLMKWFWWISEWNMAIGEFENMRNTLRNKEFQQLDCILFNFYLSHSSTYGDSHAFFMQISQWHYFLRFIGRLICNLIVLFTPYLTPTGIQFIHYKLMLAVFRTIEIVFRLVINFPNKEYLHHASHASA